MKSEDSVTASKIHPKQSGYLKKNLMTYLMKYVGIGLMVASMVLYAIMTLLTSYIFQNYPEINSLDMMLIRVSSMLLFTFPQVRYYRVNIFDVPKCAWKALLLKSFNLGIGMLIIISALKYVNVYVGTQLFYTQPIIVVLIGHFFENERLSLFRLILCLVCFIGVGMISYEKFSLDFTDDALYETLGYLACLVGCVTGIIQFLAGRELNKYVHFIYGPVYAYFLAAGIIAFFLILFPSMFNFNSYTYGFAALSGEYT